MPVKYLEMELVKTIVQVSSVPDAFKCGCESLKIELGLGLCLLTCLDMSLDVKYASRYVSLCISQHVS